MDSIPIQEQTFPHSAFLDRNDFPWRQERYLGSSPYARGTIEQFLRDHPRLAPVWRLLQKRKLENFELRLCD
jgi:hypothetical protein